MTLDVLNLLAVIVAALAGGWVARRLGYPSILGELAAGIVLGPPLLGLVQSDDALSVIGKLGVVLLMLYIGIHLDPGSIGRAAKPGALAALGGFVVPAGLGFALMMAVDGDPVAAAFVATAMGVTSLATKSRILVDLGILNTRVAHVLMAGALVSDVAALVVFAGLLGFAASGTLAVGSLGLTAVWIVVFLIGSWLVGTRVFPLVGRWLSRRSIDPSIRFLIVVAIGLLFAAAAAAVDLHEILGAFLAGLFLREGVLPRDQLADVEGKVRLVSVGFLAPIFFVTAGFDVSFDVFAESPLLLLAVVVLATAGKVLGTALFYLPTGYGFREGIAVGAGMNGRGAVEIIVAELALAAGIIDTEIFSILVFMAIFTTATVPILLTRSVAWLRSRGELVTDEREGVVFVGASPLARHLALMLDDPRKVTLIDTNADHRREAEAAGLSVVAGSALDEQAMDEAGAAVASTLVAITANHEVNLLASQLAARHFGIPDIKVAFTHEATDAMIDLLDSAGGELLFGRPVDLKAWDVDIHEGRVTELRYSADDADDARAAVGAGGATGSSTLPLVVSSGSTTQLYSPDRSLGPEDVVLAIARVEEQPAGAPEPSPAAGD